jgi:hypothetical protein
MSIPKLEEHHYFQLMDRLNIISDNIDTHLLQHQTCKLDKEITRKIEIALDSIHEAYSLAKKRFAIETIQFGPNQNL